MSEPDRPPQPLVVSLAALTVVSGFLDAVSYPRPRARLHRQHDRQRRPASGSPSPARRGSPSAASLCALGCFLVGAVVGGRIWRRAPVRRDLADGRHGDRGAFTSPPPRSSPRCRCRPSASGWPRFTVIALLAFGMGVRNAAVRRLGVADMTTTVLTTTLTGLASDSSLAGGTNPNAARRLDLGRLACSAARSVGAALVLHVHPALGARRSRPSSSGARRVVLLPGGAARARPGLSLTAVQRRRPGRARQTGRPSSRYTQSRGLAGRAPTRRRNGPLRSARASAGSTRRCSESSSSCNTIVDKSVAGEHAAVEEETHPARLARLGPQEVDRHQAPVLDVEPHLLAHLAPAGLPGRLAVRLHDPAGDRPVRLVGRVDDEEPARRRRRSTPRPTPGSAAGRTASRVRPRPPSRDAQTRSSCSSGASTACRATRSSSTMSASSAPPSPPRFSSSSGSLSQVEEEVRVHRVARPPRTGAGRRARRAGGSPGRPTPA